MKPPIWTYKARWLGVPGFVLLIVASTAVDHLALFLILIFLGLLLLAVGTVAMVLTFFRSPEGLENVPSSIQPLIPPGDSVGQIPISLRRIALLACGVLMFVVIGAVLIWTTITPGRYRGDLVMLIAGIASVGFFGGGFLLFLINLVLGRVRGLVMDSEGLRFTGRVVGAAPKTIKWRHVRTFKIVYPFGTTSVGYELQQPGTGRSKLRRDLYGVDGLLPNYLATSNAQLLVTLDAWRRRFGQG